MEKMHATFSRRGIIRRTALVMSGGAIAAAGLGQGIAWGQGAKIAQGTAQYQTTPKDKAQCDNCGSFIAPAGCKVVAGTISPAGWCSLYNAKA